MGHLVGQWTLNENGLTRYEISETEIPLRISVDPDPFFFFLCLISPMRGNEAAGIRATVLIN
jgi:hypothetical protein